MATPAVKRHPAVQCSDAKVTVEQRRYLRRLRGRDSTRGTCCLLHYERVVAALGEPTSSGFEHQIGGGESRAETRGAVPKNPKVRYRPPTSKQLAFLRRLGYTGEPPEGRIVASRLIDELLKEQAEQRRDHGAFAPDGSRLTPSRTIRTRGKEVQGT